MKKESLLFTSTEGHLAEQDTILLRYRYYEAKRTHQGAWPLRAEGPGFTTAREVAQVYTERFLQVILSICNYAPLFGSQLRAGNLAPEYKAEETLIEIKVG